MLASFLNTCMFITFIQEDMFLELLVLSVITSEVILCR